MPAMPRSARRGRRGRGDRRRHRVQLGPLLPAVRRPGRRALRVLDHARRLGAADQPGRDRRAGHLQQLPQPRAAGRHGAHGRPHQRRPADPRASARAGSRRTTSSTATTSAPPAPGWTDLADALPRIESRWAQAEPGADPQDPGADRRRRREQDAAAGRPARRHLALLRRPGHLPAQVRGAGRLVRASSAATRARSSARSACREAGRTRSRLLAAGARLFTVGLGGPTYDLSAVRDWVAWRDRQ